MIHRELVQFLHSSASCAAENATWFNAAADCVLDLVAENTEFKVRATDVLVSRAELERLRRNADMYSRSQFPDSSGQ